MFGGMATLARLVLSLTAALALAGHPATRIPAGVRTIDVHSSRGISRQVTDPAKVTKIVRWFDRLHTVRPGVFACPMLVAGPTITLVFRGATGVLARAGYAADFPDHSLVSTQCTPIRYSVGGRRQKALIGGRFLPRVQQLLGERLLR
jgi:hypothetical protein